MKAAICYDHGQPLQVEEVLLDPPQSQEVRIKLKATAICHSDVHQIRGEWGSVLPEVCGHEAAGIVAEVGPGVTRVKPGDHVLVSLLWECGECQPCLRGHTHLCQGQFAHVTERRMHTHDGQPITHGIRTAAFAEETIVHESQLVSLPQEMPLDSACLLACGVITGVGAVLRTARVAPDQSVVILGTGGVGLNTVQGARLVGAHPIIAVDLLDEKLVAAQAFGATHVVNATTESAKEVVARLTDGRGVDYVFVTVGSTGAAEQGFAMASERGTVVFVGIPDFRTTISLPLGLTILREKRIIGSFMGSTHLHRDVPELIDLYQNGQLKLDELISNRYPLEQINEAIEEMEQGHVLRNVIVFD